MVMEQKLGSNKVSNQGKKEQASSTKSREAAFSLLHKLISNTEQTMRVFTDDMLLPMIRAIKNPKKWGFVAPNQRRNDTTQDYRGLVNLGCICYMNSMMQQFFMIPNLRYNLLCVDDGKEDEMVEHKGYKIDDNMFHQL